LNTATTKVNIVSPFREHWAFNFNNPAKAVHDGVLAGSSWIRPGYALKGLIFRKKCANT
jgi:hypothetical protein